MDIEKEIKETKWEIQGKITTINGSKVTIKFIYYYDQISKLRELKKVLQIFIYFQTPNIETVVYQLTNDFVQGLLQYYQIQIQQLKPWLQTKQKFESLPEVFKVQEVPQYKLTIGSLTFVPYSRSKVLDHQKCYLAFKIISQIMNYSYQNHKMSLNQVIIQKINSLNVQKDNKRLFLSYFQHESQIKNMYDSQIYSQKRFQQASSNNFLVYNPSLITKRMIENILLDEQKPSLLFYGRSGTGKTMSLSLINELFKYISEYKNKVCFQNKIPQLMNSQQFKIYKSIPMMFFFSFYRQNNNVGQFQASFRKQLPFQLLKQTKPTINTCQLIQLISNYLKQQNVSLVYIIDQINNYYSLKRRDQLKEIKSISNLLGLLIKRKERIIFSSSQNLEFYAQNFYTHNFIDVLKVVKTQKIINETRNINLKGIVQIIHIFKFQYKKLLHHIQDVVKKDDLSRIVVDIYEILLIFICNQGLDQVIFYLAEATHEKISSFLATKSIREEILSFLSAYQPQNIMSVQDALNHFRELFSRLHEFIVKVQSNNYEMFIIKAILEEDICQRYRQTLQIRQYAKEKIQLSEDDQILSFFDYKFNGYEINLSSINKDHTEIIDKHTIRIYYTPQTFLQITQFIAEKFRKNFSHHREFIRRFSDKRNWLGETIDTTLVYIFTKADMTVYLGNQQLTVKRSYQKNHKQFIHFYNIQDKSSNNSVYKRFGDIFQLINRKSWGNNFIALSPRKLRQNNTFREKTMSSTSQAIDCLLIGPTKFKSKYSFITLDFCISFNRELIDCKMNKAKKFFKKFVQIKQKQNSQGVNFKEGIKKVNYELQIQHFIVIPNCILKSFKKSDKLYTARNNNLIIELIAIESLRFIYHSKPDQQQYSQFMKIKEALLQQLKNISQRYYKK